MINQSTVFLKVKALYTKMLEMQGIEPISLSADLVAAREEGVHGEVGEPVQVLQTGVDPDFGGEVRVRELIHCSTHQRGFDSFLILQLLNTVHVFMTSNCMIEQHINLFNYFFLYRNSFYIPRDFIRAASFLKIFIKDDLYKIPPIGR